MSCPQISQIYTDFFVANFRDYRALEVIASSAISELVYQTRSLEFQERGIPFKAEVALPVRYKDKLLTCVYRADFICYETILVETKAISKLTIRRRPTH